VKQLKDKVVVITGAASGIGRALSLAAADLGMRVVLADIDNLRLEGAASEARSRGAEAVGIHVDVGQAKSVATLAEEAYGRFGAVHLLINNAGVGAAGAAWTLPLETWERVLRINLNGVIHGIHAFLPRMLASGEPGHVVNVASAAGLSAGPSFAAYSASKFAVVGLSESLYQDLALRRANVGVSLLCPSWVQTRIADEGAAATPTSDAVDQHVQAAVTQAVAHGMPAEQIAAQVFKAVEDERFYILTHPDTHDAVRQRSENILQGLPPMRLDQPEL
jgi:NAD(P)-dependent dehydrogenase (short-subunit alcohol dehydrogenase family)